MGDKNEYLYWLKAEIEREYNCPAYFLRTETVHESVEGNTVWLGDVEIFGLIGHLEARRRYAWGHEYDGSGPAGRLVMMLAIPSAISAPNAVWIQLVKDLRSRHPD
jgi:hypothetical protein